MGKPSRDKGMRRERQIVALHTDMNIRAERVPLSGAARYQQNGGDVDVYLPGFPMHTEVKGRANGEGFKTLERWLGDNDAIYLIRDRAAPLVVLPWATYARIVGAIPAPAEAPSVPPQTVPGDK